MHITVLNRSKTLLFLILILSNLLAFSQSRKDEKRKADLIYLFGWNLIWENNEQIKIIKIGVLNGNSIFLRKLRAIASKGYQDVVTIEVLNFKHIKDIQETNILFVDKSKGSQVPKILDIIKYNNTALVTDSYGVKKHISINFIKEYGKIVFEYNLEKLEEHGVGINKKIKKNGILIDTKALYKESELNLKTEKERVKYQKKEIKKQKEAIRTQKSKIKKQNKEIEKKQSDIEEKQFKIDIQNNLIKKRADELDSMQILAEERNSELDFKNTELNSKNTKIIEQQEKLNVQISKFKEQDNILAKQDEKIAERQKQIDSQENEIKNQNITIKYQESILLLFTILTVIIILLVIFTFRAYRIIRKDNALLAQQKTEIQQQSTELEYQNKELEKLSIVASQTSNAVIILDKKGDFEWINAGFTRMYGYTFQLLTHEIDKNIKKASGSGDINGILERCTKSKKPFVYESLVQTRYGFEKWSQTTISPILDNNEELDKFVLIDSDITEIKEAEQEIIKQNKKILAQTKELALQNKELEKLSLVASKTDNSVIIASPNGDIEWVNDGFTRMLGLSFDEFKNEYGKNIFKISLISDLKKRLEVGIKNKRTIIYTGKTTTKDGKRLWIQTTLTPILDKDNKLSKIIAIDANVTKIKLAEQEIALQKQKITDSIIYARRIQTAMLPPKELLASQLPDYFILFKPRDIVSGDFYWLSQRENYTFIAAADSTGHGVPGAFMSMLGISFLNQLVSQLDYDSLLPGNILTELRESVKTSLRQTGKENEAKDGMDLALCQIDNKANKMLYAGAHNPLILIRDNELIQYKADDMPIGISYNEKAFFNTKIIDILPGDCFYIFSDGYPDQFGGKKGRKFMIKRFKRLLVEIHQKPMGEQRKILNRRLVDWQGLSRQIDDILVIGLKF